MSVRNTTLTPADATESNVATTTSTVSEKEIHDSNPLKYLQGLGDDFKRFFGPLLKKDDRSVFFAESHKRVCRTIPDEYVLPLVPSSTIARSMLHEHSFKLANVLSDDMLEKLSPGAKAVLDSLRTKQTLEMEPATGLPMTAKVGASNRKVPFISDSKETNFYTHNEILLRYFPAIVAAEKHVQYEKVISADTKAMLSNVLYNISGDLPERESDAARALWEEKVMNKLWITTDKPCTLHTQTTLPTKTGTDEAITNYAICYSICMPGARHAHDTFECQGYRIALQAGATLVQHWIEVTEALVGAEAVPHVARNYVANQALIKADFFRESLCKEAADVCKREWPSLFGAATVSVNAKDKVTRTFTPEIVQGIVSQWVDKKFGNPCIEVADGDAQRTTEMLFNANVDEAARMNLLVTRAGWVDGETYQAAAYHANLKKMSGVYKELSYLLAGKEIPSAMVVFDSEETAASASAGRVTGRKRKQAAVAGPSSAAGGASPEVLAKLETLVEDNRMIKELLAKEAKRSLKLRNYVYANLPQLPAEEEEEGEEQSTAVH